MTLKKSSKNIFDDLGFSTEVARDLKYRAHLLLYIKKIVEKKGYTRRDLKKIIDIPQPRVSELMTGKIDRFSSNKLFAIIEKLGFEVELKLRRA